MRVADRAGREVNYRYSNGDLSEVIDVLGQSTRYAYDAKHQLTQITDASSRITRINYVVSLDPPVGAGGVKLGKAPPTAKDRKDTLYAGGPPQVSSNAPLSGYRVSRVGRVTDPAGQATTYETTYDKTTRQFSTLITYPGGRKVIEVHDLEGRLLQKSHGSRVTNSNATARASKPPSTNGAWPLGWNTTNCINPCSPPTPTAPRPGARTKPAGIA